MSYPFIQAQYHGDPGSFRQLRALTVHMAEGGGTVAWLTHPSNANSSHFVIEYSGRIVQMVRDDEYDFSLHVARPAGPPGPGDYGIFSLDTAKAVLGDGIGDPNRYMFAVELEGFAAVGPNADQARALGVLVSDLRSRYPSMRGLLGHRDFQNYKPCPGGAIPWAQLGGHGLFAAAPQPEADVNPKYDMPVAVADVSAGTPVIDATTGATLLPSWNGGSDIGLYSRGGGNAAIRIDLGAGGSDLHVAYVRDTHISNVRLPGAQPPTGSAGQAELDAATAAGFADAKAKALTAVGGIS